MTASSFSIGIVQCALGDSREANVARVEALIREAAKRGAQIIVTPELFEGPYFPQAENEQAFDLAAPFDGHPTVARTQALAAELAVVLPVSFFERAGQAHYNSLAMIDADGARLGVYRKSHIPDGPGYEEKFYFRPGDTGFRVWKTRYGCIGAGICWDQWFPEAARSMALQGADVLLYPTAIGSEPNAPDDDTKAQLKFYGSSFICDQRGDIEVELSREEEGVAVASFEREVLRRYRANWGFFRDRRPELYGSLTGDEPVD
jgi:N-carbamoylputrescine amidase